MKMTVSSLISVGAVSSSTWNVAAAGAAATSSGANRKTTHRIGTNPFRAVKDGSMFFFEKKNQKTFDPWRPRRVPRAGAKVFCFFFSK
jgi:hypothetical protein